MKKIKCFFSFMEIKGDSVPAYFLSVNNIPKELYGKNIFFNFEEKRGEKYFLAYTNRISRSRSDWLYNKSRHIMLPKEYKKMSTSFYKSSLWVLALASQKDVIKYLIIERETGKIKDSFKSLPQKKE